MYTTKIVGLLAMLAVGGHSFSLITAPLHGVHKAVSGSMDIGNSVVHMGTNMGSQGFQLSTDIGKNLIKAPQTFLNSGISSAAGIGHKAMGITKDAASKIPIVSSITNAATGMADMGIDAAAGVSKYIVDTPSQVGIAVMDTTNNAGQFVNSEIGKGSDAVFGTGIKVNDKIFGTINGLFSKPAAAATA